MDHKLSGYTLTIEHRATSPVTCKHVWKVVRQERAMPSTPASYIKRLFNLTTTLAEKHGAARILRDGVELYYADASKTRRAASLPMRLSAMPDALTPLSTPLDSLEFNPFFLPHRYKQGDVVSLNRAHNGVLWEVVSTDIYKGEAAYTLRSTNTASPSTPDAWSRRCVDADIN